jgi:ribosomal protein L32
MSLTRCPKCGEVFAREKFSICNSCRQKENEKIDLIRRYVNHNPDATVEELERISGIPHEAMMTLVREGKLTGIDVLQIVLTCEECGVEITSGRFCKRCSERLSSKFSATLGDLKARKKS